MSAPSDSHDDYLRWRAFLKRAGWSAADIAAELEVSGITARQYAQAPGTPGSRAIPDERLSRLREAARREAAAMVMTAMELADEGDAR